MELGVDACPLLFLFLYILVAWRGRALNDAYALMMKKSQKNRLVGLQNQKDGV